MKKDKNTDKEIAENVKWFKKFSVLERLKIALVQQEASNILRRMKIEGIKKPS